MASTASWRPKISNLGGVFRARWHYTFIPAGLANLAERILEGALGHPKMKAKVKKALLSFRLGRSGYGRVHEARFEWTYRRRRERYEALVAGDNRAHSPDASIARARARLAKRGYAPPGRTIGEVHTFAYVPSNWSHQNQIASALSALGPCSRFDYVSRGVPLKALRSCELGHRERRDEVLTAMLAELRTAHRRRPVDWFFSYALGWDMTVDTLRIIHEELGIPTVNISLDDKNWWDEIERGDDASALRHIVPQYDLGWTSARVVLPCNRCRINLGLGDMHYSRWLTNLKGRDFEVPATGKGLYLTSYNSDLAQCFSIGREIQCYRGIDELIELVRYHLSNEDESAMMAMRAREHCVRAHQWKHRYITILQALGIVGADACRSNRRNGTSGEVG